MNLLDIIKQEHALVKSFWAQYESSNMLKEKEQLGYTIVRLVSMHAAKEEEVVYPVIAEKEGKDIAEHCLEEHQKLKELLDQVNNSNISDAKFDSSLRAAMQELLHHIKEEEEEIMPRLAQTGVDMQELGRKYEAAEAHAPTRPHPNAPNKPPLNVAAHMTAAPLDAAADLIRFGAHPPKLKPQPAH